ncbi:MAG: AbrB/MazE/SpoVT family DNA-binding domain-containing protein [Chloroflexi bacterium]|nr:AbrB/MazE/SpoVT family DNA-binding domain-containing protein [Chloroflexota bacterium]
MIRKIFKTGNSLVVSLPKEVLDVLQLSDGAGVSVELDQGKRKIVISPVELPLAISGVDAAFARQVDAFIEQYRPALEELAK